MSAGEKLQKAAEKVFKKLGTQDGSVSFVTTSVVPGTAYGMSYQSSSTVTVNVAQGLKISRANRWDAISNEAVNVGDLVLTVPGHLFTEATLDTCNIQYGGQTYKVISYNPTSIISGLPVKWRVIAGIRGNG